ncbi:MAG: hypothetical protein KatS3mg105_2796 [Gemmatales bacterium]|nr:MAG: hypothetical protein KatS3mg105_2796 [Gemmatales bacterium]
MANHDAGYRMLFSDKRLVADLIRGFISESWVADLDLDSLEPVNASFVSERFEKRESDVIWRVRFRDHWLYLYLLIEFQSTVDRLMALRLMVYVGLLYQRLLSEKEIKESEMLPPVVSIVLYNGTRRWTAPRDVGELIADAGHEELTRYLPRLSYFLLEEHAQDLAALAGMHNLAAIVFRLEQCRSQEDIEAVFAELSEWASVEEHRETVLRIGRWLEAVAASGKRLIESPAQLQDFREYGAMLKETVEQWRKQAREEGYAQGVEEGLAEGMEKGIQKGLQQGIQQGIHQGIQQGIQQGMAKGRSEGEAEVLMRLLNKKFGTIPEEYGRRIREADQEQLLTWADRILTAESIEDVFRA